ncbi:mug2/mug135/meu2 family [Schizosaccharomyces pombe]|uniref:UPF0612 protein new22 n=1 Tax=Schizosaccharomyces pombe (strain 972 / ATCC 24843) TaxID=284812 RepID=NEW22_SCHPO|nr:protein new22 [Schizosaccharomyces pombe]G2TRT2.1 RecName: Full=UPF0612 protein new22 [Schizosaccharomyces pombe 972h-]CCD31386.1 cell surface glycoprotein (predicted), DUF1773 family protein 6 [Schizosaccharomyces pombe]|eukprot:NP_001343176.1 protein new22 [Schizosaccharomyces pombe]
MNDNNSCKLTMLTRRLENMTQEYGQPDLPVPFLNGDEPGKLKLPLSERHEDVDYLTKEQCIQYFNGYSIHLIPPRISS